MRLLCALFILLSISCSNEIQDPQDFKVSSNWVVYDHNEEIVFYDLDGNEHIATVEYIDQGKVVFKVDLLDDIFLRSNEGQVSITTTVNGETHVGQVWAESYDEYVDLLGIFPQYGTFNFCGKDYHNTLQAHMFQQNKQHHVYLQRGFGIIAIKLKHGSDILRICR